LTTLNYKAAGVDIHAGNQFVERIKSLTKQTHTSNVLSGIGGFAALYALPQMNFREPILVSATDGVGTKLKLAIQCNRHDTIGIDLVAMCVNDVIVCGATPLFFLDYFASGKLNLATGEAIIKGIAEGCTQAQMALIGGETAEMPGMYQGDDYDLAGFCVGVVDKPDIIDGHLVKPTDVLIGIASSGFHSNGYSLVRKLLDVKHLSLDHVLSGKTLGERLLMPTKIYVQALKALRAALPVHACAHITGGGLLENIPRVLPLNVAAHLDTSRWQWPEVMTWVKNEAQLADEEMHRTFNCGIGMVVCVAQDQADQALNILTQHGETAWIIGDIRTANGAPHVVMS
jgi:phosphoribosylformylglycinamidine cyclo-ligase